MWQRVIEFVDQGRALMVYTARNEQRLAFMVHGHDWLPVAYDGISLMRRRTVPAYIPTGLLHNQVAAVERSAPTSGIASETVWKRRNARRKFKRKE